MLIGISEPLPRVPPRAIHLIELSRGGVREMLLTLIAMNIGLCVFNFLPIPPLDGSHVMKYLLPPSWAIRYQQVGMYGVFVLMILMMTRFGAPLLSAWMTPVNIIGGALLRAISQFVLPSQFTLGM